MTAGAEFSQTTGLNCPIVNCVNCIILHLIERLFRSCEMMPGRCQQDEGSTLAAFQRFTIVL